MKPGRRFGRPELLIAGLALAASAAGIGNGFVYDDVPIILHNPAVHQLTDPVELWGSAYWPSGLLYRPLTIQVFALEWALGAGRPVVFHLVSVGLMLLVALLFWRLARHLLEPLPAFAAAALFAVHPVHVEAVANGVGQSELLAALFALLAVERYLTWRRDGPLGMGRRAALAGFTLAAILSKETGYVTPFLLLGAEALQGGRGATWRARLRALGPVLFLQFGIALSAFLLRLIVLGAAAGEVTAPALRDLSPATRIGGMLAAIPEWTRLLFWPAHLQAEYGPPALPVTGGFGLAHLVGLAILLLALGLVARSWRTRPVIALGVVWVAIALAPASNVFVASGVILAERTLFLPSAGAMLALGGALAVVLPRLEAAGSLARGAVALVLAAVVLAGLLRSAERQRVWRDETTFFHRLETDAPTTYRAHLVASNFYSGAGRHSEAERAAQRAFELFKGDPQVFEQFGQTLRREGRCAEAIPILAEGVQRFPDRTVGRSRLIECALAVGDTARARGTAEEAVRLGQREFEGTLRRLSRP